MTEETLTGEISGLAFGGDGILRDGSLVVFIPFTAPGDLISYRITSKKKNYARGELVEILKSGKERTVPRCPYFGTCGGCQLQHLTYPAQLEHKRMCVEDSLKRIGRIPIDVVSITPANQSWAYRRHVTLTLTPKNDTYEAGYIGIDGHSVVPVNSCPIFVSEENQVIQELQKIVSQLKSSLNNSGKASILKQDNDQFLLQLHFPKTPPNCSTVCQEALNRNPIWKGILVNTEREKLTFGNSKATCRIDHLEIEFSPKAFIQNHPEQSLNIYRRICALASQVGPKSILDLYCGVGISSLLLAGQGMFVVGVEGNKEAVQLANKNAQSNGIKQVSFIQADVAHVLGSLLEKHGSDIVILNPPRIGADESVCQELVKRKPKHIIYISCNPATLARDLQRLGSQNYRVLSCEAFDMFPQTAHVETLVHLICNES